MVHSRGLPRFRTRRDAETALSEIIADGGRAAEFRIDAIPGGGFLIVILEDDGEAVAGTLGV